MAAALLARHHHRLGKRHLIADLPFAFADRAAAFGIEAEPLRPHAVLFGEQPADLIHRACVGGGCGADGGSNRLLVDHDGIWAAFHQFIAGQRGFPGPRHAGDRRQYAFGNRHINVLQIVAVCVLNGKALRPGKRRLVDLNFPVHGLGGQGVSPAQSC